MKYLLQNYPDPETAARLSAHDLETIRDEYVAITQSPGVIAGEQLQPVETATTVRVRDGEMLLTDGPFVDAKEHVGGFLLIEADDLDAALELAARLPAARMGGAVEVRPLVER
jgi:hypothetical protein